jgi:hypothetical protein
MREEPEEKRKSETEDEAGNDREVKGGVLAAMDDVAGQAAEAEGKSAAEIEKSADDSEERGEEEKSAAEIAQGIHKESLGDEVREVKEVKEVKE